MEVSSQERRVLRAWKIYDVTRSHLYAGGAVNRNMLLETPRGAFVLRRSQPSKTATHLREEIRVIEHAQGDGLPAVLPLKTRDNAMFVSDNNALFTLFPKVKARQLSCADLTVTELGAMGKTLAELTLALEDCPAGNLPHRPFSTTAEETLARLEGLEHQILAHPDPETDEVVALAMVRTRRAFLKQHPCEMVTDTLTYRVAHGDYHERNLFFAEDKFFAEGKSFAGNKVVAIIDWDQVRVTPRYFELLRAAQFLLGQLNIDDVRHFITAFRRAYPVDEHELAATVKLFSAERAHNLWLLEAIYFEANARARVFLPRRGADAYTPFEATWRKLSAG